MSTRILITGGCVLTLDPKTANLPRGDVLIEDGRVAEVAPSIRARSAELVDATDTIVMPGFVDANRHAWHALFRNRPDGPAPADYAAQVGPDDVHAAILGGLLGAVDAGITTVVDWFDLGTDLIEPALAAHAEAGIRSVLVAAPGGAGDPGESLRALQRGRQESPLTTLAVGAAIDGAGGLAGDPSLAAGLGLRSHVQVQGPSPGLDRVAGEATTFVGCTGLTDNDFDLIKSTGTSVCLTPAADMAAGAGPPPIQQLIDRSVRPGLGVGSERIAPGDMFAQMRAVISMQHATVFDRKLAGKAGLPTLLNTREVIRYATADSARAAGLWPGVGTITPGARADLIVLRADRPNIFPINDPIGAVVWGMDTSNVDWVFVDGRPLKRAGALAADITAVRDGLIAAAARLERASGLLADTSSEVG